MWPPAVSSKTEDLPGLDARPIPGQRAAKPGPALWTWDLQSTSSDAHWSLRIS